MNKGFTLVELTVAIGVSVIISAMILANLPEFNRRLDLSRTAQLVALSFRRAESSALAVREFGVESFPAYGLHFENPPAKSYIFFADTDEDYKNPESASFYDDPNERADTFVINTAPVIEKLCVNLKSSPPGDCSVNWLDILYVRPNPDIYILTDKGQFSDAAVILGLPGGEEQRIIIWTTGQLYVESAE